jgi:cellulose synthase (UDP-forming)
MFNHGIQGGRDNWKGAFFVGSGAVFRRQALEGIGGFKLMSITEDIHSSQHLHAKGYTSVFVDKDLAVGLAAEDYASYIVQRKRWMQGCLQIFFKNNPLFQEDRVRSFIIRFFSRRIGSGLLL